MISGKHIEMRVFDLIVQFLVESNSSLQSDDSDFSSGLKIAGVICHACKYMRQLPFNGLHKRLIAMVLDARLTRATLETQPILLNAHELVHLKLVAISLAKEQAGYWHNEHK